MDRETLKKIKITVIQSEFIKKRKESKKPFISSPFDHSISPRVGPAMNIY